MVFLLLNGIRQVIAVSLVTILKMPIYQLIFLKYLKTLRPFSLNLKTLPNSKLSVILVNLSDESVGCAKRQRAQQDVARYARRHC